MTAMWIVSMVPLHEQEHIQRLTHHFREMPLTFSQSLARAFSLLANARVYDAFLDLHDLLKHRGLDASGRTHLQLQIVRCLAEGPMERLNAELELITPRDAYQKMVFAYRNGWISLYRKSEFFEANQYFEQVVEDARLIGSRCWECEALLQKANVWTSLQDYDQAIKLFDRVYNLSRRNGMVEYIPQALMGKGRTYIEKDDRRQAENALHKAYELACRNELAGEKALVLYVLARTYHYDFRYYGLASQYYEQAQTAFEQTPLMHSVHERLTKDMKACAKELDSLDIAKIIGIVPLSKLRQEYLTSLVNGFVGIPGIENRSQLGERIGLTRQAIYRNING